VEPGGSERFADAAVAWRGAIADAVLKGAGGPTLLGGLGFTGRQPASDGPWRSFGPASLVLPTFCLVRDGPSATLTVALPPGGKEDPHAVESAWDSLVRDAGLRGDPPAASNPLRIVDEQPDRVAWERTVGRFAGAVGRGRIDKVVLARQVVLDAPMDLDVEAALRHLARTAAESTTFAFVRDGTTFVGATPERLVRTSGRSFETVAIAGSAPRGRDADEDARYAAALLADEKEREEHAVVVDMLRTSLWPIVEDLRIAPGPGVLPLPHVQHLVTPVGGTTRDEAGLLALGGRLHPTPAVGGAPRDIALSMIEEHEGFDRGWYAGPIGWLGADGDGELMVALRCGLVRGARATLFAGCGIVADSDPAREWDESRLKLRTMISALGGANEDER
jgi:isochorismate synthase